MGDRAALEGARSSSALQAGGRALPGCTSVICNTHGQLEAAKEGVGLPCSPNARMPLPWVGESANCFVLVTGRLASQHSQR